MSKRTKLAPGIGDEWVECLVIGHCYYLEFCGGDSRHTDDEFMLMGKEVLALSLLHPAVRRLITWASSIAGATNTKLKYPVDWAKGREVLKPFEGIVEEIENG